MLSFLSRRVATELRHGLPPPFLLPWAASMTTESVSTGSSSMPRPALPTSEPSPNPQLKDSTLGAPSPISTDSHAAPVSTNPSNTAKNTLTTPSPQASKAPPRTRSATPPSLSASVKELLPLLTAQRQIYITAHIHARPYLLTQGDTVRLPFLMPGVEPGDVLRLNRATTIGSRDFTLRAAGTERRGKSVTAGTVSVPDPVPASSHFTTSSRVLPPNASASLAKGAAAGAGHAPQPTEHFVPHLAKGRFKYLDDRLFVCRAVVLGTEAEPLRIKEKTKRRQRHTRHVKSKHKYTILRIKEVRVRSLEEVEGGGIE